MQTKRPIQALQIAFTYMGTIVGAGFATGQEIMQFFTRFGSIGALTILIATALFIWLGIKMMLIAGQIGAHSYEDLNKQLFGDKVGRWVSLFMLFILLGVNAVMLAGAGSLFSENLNLSYQTGLILTLVGCFFVLRKGMRGILAINAIVVPIMLAFTAIVAVETFAIPGSSRWLYQSSDHPLWAVWASPLLYTAFNLSMAQAVLVPLGAHINDRKTIIAGGWIGGVGIGIMLLVAHIALSIHMPGITQFEIPMGGIARYLGQSIQWMYLAIIFSEIFTTLVADVYGLSLQLQQRIRWKQGALVLSILLLCYLISQLGFGPLLSTLYPLFGIISLGWLYLMIRYRQA